MLDHFPCLNFLFEPVYFRQSIRKKTNRQNPIEWLEVSEGLARFVVVPTNDDTQEKDFQSVIEQVFVFEYTSNFDIEEKCQITLPTERSNEYILEIIRSLVTPRSYGIGDLI